MASIGIVSTATHNTKEKGSVRRRMYLLTVNEASLQHYEDIKTYLTSLKNFNYMLTTEHIGQENKHYHIALQFTNNTALSIDKLHGAHIDVGRYGSIQRIIAYCKCEDKKHKELGITYQLIDEIGEYRKRGGMMMTIKEAKEMTDDEIDECPVNLINCINKVRQNAENEIDVDDLAKTVKVYYIQGPSGKGKTEKAKTIIRNNIDKYGRKLNMVKYENGFWCGCSANCKIALYDDFRDTHMRASEFINFIDYNIHHMNIKGGALINHYELIILTSVQRITDIYKNMKDEPRKQWLRRIELIDMYEMNDDEMIFDIDEI